MPRVDTRTFFMWTVDSVDTGPRGPVSLTSGFMELRNTKVWAAAAAAMIHPSSPEPGQQRAAEQLTSRGGGGGGVCRIVCSARVTCNNVI